MTDLSGELCEAIHKDYLDPPIDDPVQRDELRLALAEKMMDRGDDDLARKSASGISQEPLRARAEEILSDLDERDSED